MYNVLKSMKIKPISCSIAFGESFFFLPPQKGELSGENGKFEREKENWEENSLFPVP